MASTQIDLYLLRHGEFDAVMSADVHEDARLPLSEAGITRLKREAETLTAWRLPIDTLLSSPFVRARQTAGIIADTLHLPVTEDSLLTRTEFGVRPLEQILVKYPAARHLLLVGHEPDFSTVAAAITGGAIQIERGGLMKITVTSQNPLRGELIWLVTPQILGAGDPIT